VQVGDLDSLTVYLLNTRGWKPTLSRPTEFRRPKKQFEVPTWNCKGTKQISQVKTLKDYLLGNQEYFRKVLHIVGGDFAGLWAAMLRFHPGQTARELIPNSRDSSPSPTSYRTEHHLSTFTEQVRPFLSFPALLCRVTPSIALSPARLAVKGSTK
jgi:hypothetical protein